MNKSQIMPQPVGLSLRGVCFSYGAEFALEDLNLDIDVTEFVSFIGPSGCGKTTLLNIISGLLKPTEGDVLFDRKVVTSLSPAQRNIAQVFQFPVVYDSMTVAENLAFPLKNIKMSKQL